MTVGTGTVQGAAHAVLATSLGELTVVREDGGLAGLYFPRHWPRPDRAAFGPRVSEGFEEELSPCFSVSMEEELLRLFTVHRELDIPPGFCREDLYLIFMKSSPPPKPPPSPDPPWFYVVEKFPYDKLEAEVVQLRNDLADIEGTVTWRARTALKSNRWINGAVSAARKILRI